ncbi:MAG: hypothetical protein IT379_25540 [Deltaproteobacteria bacterium]|nr:hypothetical protein [Deltaproteobacteria bacterium]
MNAVQRRLARAVSAWCIATSAAATVVACGPVEPRAFVPGDGSPPPLVDAGQPACRGNGDGVVARDEVVFAPGVEVRYRVNPPGTTITLDVDGEVGADGLRVWDFSSLGGDLYPLTLVTAADRWFASSFPAADYAARLDPRDTVLGVYDASDGELALLGAAGEDESSGTLLAYDQPVPLLRFPLTLGASWSTEAVVMDGRVGGAPVASRDRYDVTVDAVGEMRLGILTFSSVLRVRVEIVQTFPAGPGVRRIQYLWLAECYGEVARATSRDGEVDPSFGEAVELRRLGL